MMKNRIFYTALLITASYLCVEYATYGDDKKRSSLSKADQEIIKKIEEQNKGAGERTKERSKARDLIDTGKELEKTVEKLSKPASYAGTIVSIGAGATGDPHAKMGAAGFKLSIEAIKGLGIGIAKIITITGRYQERAQKILSGAEVELEDLQRLLDKKKKLERSRDDLLKVEKPSGPVQRIGYDLLLMSELPKNGKPAKGKIYLEKVRKNDSTLKDSELKYILMQPDGTVGKGTLKIQTTKDLTPEILSTFSPEILEMITKEGYTASKSESRLKQLGKGALGAAKTAEIKVRQATDILTNDKEERGKKIEAIQAELKEINKKYKERISSLEIRVVMEIVNEIDKKINIDNTIASLENKRMVSERGRNNLPKNKSKQKKEMAKIDSDEATTSKDLIYFMKFKNNPTETLEDLEKSRAELMNEVKELSALTDRGDAIYLQEKDVQLDSEMNRAAIVSLYKENDAIKSQLETLKKQLEALLKTAPSKDTVDVSVPPLKKEPSQREPLPQKTPSQGPGPLKKDANQPEASQQAPRDTGPFSKEMIKKQREALRPLPIPPQGK